MTEAKKPKKSDAEKLAELKQKEAALKAKIARIEQKAKDQERKDDTRFKIIVGGALLADSEIYQESAQFMEKILARAVTVERDKEFLASMFQKRKNKKS